MLGLKVTDIQKKTKKISKEFLNDRQPHCELYAFSTAIHKNRPVRLKLPYDRKAVTAQ
jgi:hypothetical protein